MGLGTTFLQLFRVRAVRPPAPTDREISTRRGDPGPMSSRDLRFARTRSHAVARTRRETTPTRIGTFTYFWGLRGAAPCAFEALKARIARYRRDGSDLESSLRSCRREIDFPGVPTVLGALFTRPCLALETLAQRGRPAPAGGAGVLKTSRVCGAPDA